MIFLPTPRLAYLRAFTVTIATVTALLSSGILLLIANQRTALAVGALLVLTGSLLGVYCSAAMTKIYKAWNIAAHYFARLARFALMSLCFYIVFVAVGRTGTSMKLFRPSSGQSLWVEKKSVSRHHLESEISQAYEGMKADHWLRNYLRWSKESKQIWVVALVPFIAMLAAVEASVDRRFPSGVYTLF